MPADGNRATRPASITALTTAILGSAISLYLTVEHYSSSRLLACPESATINCAMVTTSRWSQLAGVPVAVLGLIFFLSMVALLTPLAWRQPRLDAVRIAATAIGTVMVLYLIWIELFRVDAICLWCTAVHICTITLLAAVLWHTSDLRSDIG